MMFIAIKTKDGVIKGKLSFYCRMLGVSRQGFYKYLAIKDRPWKYQDLADAMRVIHAEDECNDTYGRIRMYQALLLKNPTGIKIPSERTVYRVMDEIGLVHRPKRKPNGITKADREARKSDDLLKREFKADKPLEKCVTDITEIKAKDGKLYVSAIFDCFDSSVLGLAMETNMKATLCEHTLDNAYLAHPDLRGAIVHSDRGRLYVTFELFIRQQVFVDTDRTFRWLLRIWKEQQICILPFRCRSMEYLFRRVYGKPDKLFGHAENPSFMGFKR